jgi:hypothetical protein
VFAHVSPGPDGRARALRRGRRGGHRAVARPAPGVHAGQGGAVRRHRRRHPGAAARPDVGGSG